MEDWQALTGALAINGRSTQGKQALKDMMAVGFGASSDETDMGQSGGDEDHGDGEEMREAGRAKEAGRSALIRIQVL